MKLNDDLCKIIVVHDKRIINDIYSNSDSKISDSICSTFFVHNIRKYKTHFIITVIGDGNKYYEIISPKKFCLFGNKIEIGKQYPFILHPYYKKNYTNDIINLDEKQKTYHLLYKNSILSVVIHGENIYTTPSLNGIYYCNKQDNSDDLKFDIDKYINALIDNRYY